MAQKKQPDSSTTKEPESLWEIPIPPENFPGLCQPPGESRHFGGRHKQNNVGRQELNPPPKHWPPSEPRGGGDYYEDLLFLSLITGISLSGGTLFGPKKPEPQKRYTSIIQIS